MLLVVLAAIYALGDRLAPSSSRDVVSANVVQIASRVSSEVTDVLVQDDAVVHAGAPLFKIDPRPFKLALRQAEADLAKAGQGVHASTASLVAAQANFRSAQAQLGPRGQNNPAILAAQARLESAQYDLASTVVKAPHYGVVTNVTLSPGQFVSAGTPAMTFIDAKAAWVTVDLRENQLQKVKPGDPVHLLFDAIPGAIFEGRVQSIAWGINPGRSSQGGLVANQVASRWFEPARRIPVGIELKGGMQHWPRNVRVGGKVNAVIFTDGTHNPIALLARGWQRVKSWVSYLY